MRPTIATVVTTAIWEPGLVDFARHSASLRVARRCSSPAELDQVSHRIDAVVIGTETPWLSAPLLRRLQSDGTAVVGVVASNDRAGRRILEAGDVTEIVDAADPPARILAAVAATADADRPVCDVAPVISVTGPRGAPGRSEIALALAWAAATRSDTLLVELDSDAPGLGLRLGLEPVLERSPQRQHSGPIQLLSLPARGGPLGPSLTHRLIEGARASFGAVVIDAGPAHTTGTHPASSRFVFVVQPTPSGIVRAGRMISHWEGCAPILVANRVPSGPEHSTAMRAVRAATGLEPAVALPELEMIGSEPHPIMTTLLDPVVRSVFGSDQRRAAR